jgi:hypothetical protein
MKASYSRIVIVNIDSQWQGPQNLCIMRIKIAIIVSLLRKLEFQYWPNLSVTKLASMVLLNAVMKIFAIDRTVT